MKKINTVADLQEILKGLPPEALVVMSDDIRVSTTYVEDIGQTVLCIDNVKGANVKYSGDPNLEKLPIEAVCHDDYGAEYMILDTGAIIFDTEEAHRVSRSIEYRTGTVPPFEIRRITEYGPHCGMVFLAQQNEILGIIVTNVDVSNGFSWDDPFIQGLFKCAAEVLSRSTSYVTMCYDLYIRSILSAPYVSSFEIDTDLIEHQLVNRKGLTVVVGIPEVDTDKYFDNLTSGKATPLLAVYIVNHHKQPIVRFADLVDDQNASTKAADKISDIFEDIDVDNPVIPETDITAAMQCKTRKVDNLIEAMNMVHEEIEMALMFLSAINGEEEEEPNDMDL